MLRSSRPLDGAVRIISIVLASTFLPTTGAAAPPTKPKFVLSFSAHPSLGCPDSDQLRAAITAELAYEPFSNDATTTLSISVRQSHRGVRGRVEMRLADGQRVGQRELTAPSCEELTEALVLTVVMAIDPMRAAAPKPRAPISAPPPPPKPRPAPTPVGPVTPLARYKPFNPERPRLFAAADAHVAIQSAPAPAFGFSADVGAAGEHWSAAIELRGDVPSSADVLGSRVTASSLMAALIPCGRYGVAAICAIVGGGGQSVSTAGSSYWVGYSTAGGRLEVAVPVSRRWTVLTRVDGVAPLVGKEDSRPSWRSPIAVSVGVGIAARAYNADR